jgi:hypothetical protein
VKESEVVDACYYRLVADGWHVERDVDFVDLVADHPDGRRLYVEAKGTTSSPGLDVDTLYGQLLRRMRPEEPHARYAVVVPQDLAATALRVAPEVRAGLRIDVLVVGDDGVVRPA